MYSRQGFTLVELSIVLVILGLLVGGVLSGQSLIRAAELRSITVERDKLTTALHAFQDKYFALPGDMPNAFAFWNGQATGCTDNDISAETGCNGDGNGRIDNNGSPEPIKAAMHLSLAGLIEGRYDGFTVPAIRHTPTNGIATRFETGGFWLFASDQLPVANNAGVSSPPAGTYLALAYREVDAFSSLRSLTHGESWNLDKKTDDGYGNTGQLRGSDAGDCYDLDTDGNAANGPEDVYSLIALGADTKGDCNPIFILRP